MIGQHLVIRIEDAEGESFVAPPIAKTALKGSCRDISLSDSMPEINLKRCVLCRAMPSTITPLDQRLASSRVSKSPNTGNCRSAWAISQRAFAGGVIIWQQPQLLPGSGGPQERTGAFDDGLVPKRQCRTVRPVNRFSNPSLGVPPEKRLNQFNRSSNAEGGQHDKDGQPDNGLT